MKEGVLARQTKIASSAMVEKIPIGPDDFERIVLNHQRQIYRTLLFLVRDPDVADSLTQDCFLRAFRNLSSFRCRSKVSTWLMRIAINLAQDHNRNRRLVFWRRLKRIDYIDMTQVADTQHSPEDALMTGELADAVGRALEKLSDRQRAVFMMRFIDDMALEEIAEVLQLGVGTVKTHLYRALDTVRRFCTTRNA